MTRTAGSNPNSMWSVLFPIPPLLFASPYMAMSSPLSSPPSCLCPALSLTKKFQRAALDNMVLWVEGGKHFPGRRVHCDVGRAPGVSCPVFLGEKVKGACLSRNQP
ncbi:uncharacterized protein EI90DRAFT_3012097 [Cantharellus anzutake]|uniref:uncharacterized protein n=1 Tax=Cantharellus anzutake TaxID=1750568 RepID=UPI001908697C|nr:uncharacterized protein EI90DRAFT_3012097 [Cantharellus anzutake]KAF8341551.1 hypothetical protein EI90DRAFT_3012097 [Cantharellus anzutake]